MRGRAECFGELREFCEQTPLIDCHDHTGQCGPKHDDPIRALLCGYFPSDIHSAGGDAVAEALGNKEWTLAKRWKVVEPAWQRAKHTGYGLVTKLVLREFYGEEDLTLASLKRIAGKLPDYSDAKRFVKLLDKARVAARLEDVWPDAKAVLNGSHRMSPRGKLMIGLPGFHHIGNAEHVQRNASVLGRRVATLDEYIDVCREIFEGFKRYGAVGFKDQSAYVRTLAYGNPTYAEAEEVFNWFMADPRRNAQWPDQIKPLSDYLFHAFLRMARDMDLPVQIHTGHMAGIRNDIAKTNAVLLTPVLELHQDVRFDLFHANWPYGGELLYLAKNYPNVSIDFCWANIIDPVYCQNLFRQALSSVPHGKVHGYGSDYGGNPERVWAHARIARDNIAIALSDMVETEYLGLDDAKEVARMWLFENANRFFRLGLSAEKA